MGRAASIIPLIVVLIGMLVLGGQWTIATGVPLHACETDGPARVSEAALSSYPFESIFRLDLLTIANSIPEIVEILIHDYLDMRPIALWANIRITYTHGLSDFEKVTLQYEVEDELYSKWYIDYVEPNYIYTIPENPPPPWPGFAIGELNVRFIDSSIVYNMVHNVDSDMSYETIQAAIDANETLDGHTIYVSSGTYYETVVVSKSVSLIGEAKEGTIIDGNWTGDVVEITADEVCFSEFTVRNTPLSGILVTNSTATRVSRNIIEEFAEYGIYALFSSNTVVTDNTVIGRRWSDFGIRVSWSNSCIISGNDISGGWALFLHRSQNCSLMSNRVFAKGTYGIRLAFSDSNVITSNSIFNATATVSGMSYGIWISYQSRGNTIFHNNFFNNTIQAHGHNLTNVWDNDCEGNYWSDYDGTDSDGDGIGDTEYVIDANNTDHYPLVNPYWTPGDIDHDLDVDIFDVVICANAYGATPSSPNWNPHCDIANPNGIVNIFDLVTLAASYGEEYTP